MAVEIPVFVDIDKAFEEAAKNVKTAIAPLQNQLSKNALNLRFKIDDKQTRSVKKLLEGSTSSAAELGRALKEVESRINRLQSRGGMVPGNLNQKERDLLNIYQQLQYKIAGTDNVLKQFNVTLGNTNTIINRQSAAVSKLSGLMASYLSVFTVFRFAKQIRDVTGELEYQRVALGHLIEDEEYGAKLFERIKQAAVESPFRITQLVTYTKQLAAYRIEQQNLFDTSKRLADISAGLGVSMDRLILAYGQVRAASVLRGQELRQFTEAGIPLVELLAEKMGELNKKSYSTADVFRLISERAVPFSAIADIFEDLTNKGGMFYDMQLEQAKTLKGRWEKLKDAFDIALQTAGETKTFEWQNKLVLNTLTLLAKNIRIVPKLIEALGSAWLVYNAATAIANIRNIALRKSTVQLLTPLQLQEAGVSRSAVKLLGASTASRMLAKSQAVLATSSGVLARAMARLNMVLLTNPYFAIGAAVVGIASFFLTWRKRTDETKTSMDELDETIDKLSASVSKFENNNKLISRYELLASKTERTTAENNKLYQTMGRLTEAFPTLAQNIDAETASLSENIKMLKKKNEEELEAEKKKASDMLSMAKAEQAQIEESLRAARKSLLAAQADLAPFNAFKREDLYKSQRKELDKLIEKEKSAQTEVDKLEEDWKKVSKRIETLQNLIDPAHAKGFETAWQNLMARMKDVTANGETINLISDDDIRGYETLYKGLLKIDKLYKDSAESLKAMKESLGSINEEHKEEARLEISAQEARVKGFKAILDTFGYISSYDKKSNASVLTLLKEELKNVQDIYKKYKELTKYMGSDAAKNRIEEIYGGVTTIDFLSPDSYKKRLAKLLEELRALQGKIKKGGVEVFEGWASDLKDTIKKNEGLLLEAKDIGDGVLSIGYGQARKLPDGTEITKGMKITVQQAEQYLDEMVSILEGKVKNIISLYANGLTINKEQFNILMDLAYNGGPGLVKSLLEKANGDTEKVAEYLKVYATKAVNGNKNLEAGLKKRAQRRSEGWTKAAAQIEEDANAVAQAVLDAEKIVQDVDFDEMKDELQKKLKKLSEDMKRAESARGFFDDILGLTGDTDLAASLTMSVYGETGKDFKERVQEELYRAISSIDPNMIGDKSLLDQLLGDATVLDWDDLFANIDKLPEEVRDVIRRLRGDTEKYNEETAKNYAKLLLSFDEIEQKKADIMKQYAEKRAKIEKGLQEELDGMEKRGASDAAKQAARDRASAAMDAVEREREVELYKLEAKYRLFFSSVGVMSEESARKVAATQKKMLTEQFEKREISLSKYKRELREINEQLKKYENNTGFIMTYLSSGIEGVAGKFADMGDNLRAISHTMVAEGGTSGIFALDDETMDYIDKVGMLMGGKIFGVDGVSGRSNVAEQLVAQVAKMSKDAGEFKENMIKALDAAAEASDETSHNFSSGVAVAELWVKNIGGLIKELDGLANESAEIGEGWNKFANILMKIPTLGFSKSDGAWDRFASMNEYAMSGFDKFKSGNFIGALADTIRSWSSLFGPNVKAINREIEKQSRSVSDLEYQYGRLENSIQKAFGSDYITNYTQQLDVLYAKQEAYLKQAELEESKGKKADSNKVEDYKNQAREVGDQIMDMQSKLSEFFAGTDLTSAAKDFANAWIEAYKEYGSVTTAMKEKFQDMVQSMIENSLAAKIMQELLQPIFDEIDKRALDGELSAADIATISEMATQQIPQINDAMVTLMNSLAAAGYNVRSKAGQFTGIARNIANASEESITGLAAGINTQNFYMSYMPLIYNQVAEILALMGGGTQQTAAAGATLSANNELMMMYLSSLPDIRSDIFAIKNMLASVIKVNGTPAGSYVAVNA